MNFDPVGKPPAETKLGPFRLWCGEYEVGDQRVLAVACLIRRGDKWQPGPRIQDNVRADTFLADIDEETWAQMVEDLRTSAPK